MAWMERRTEKRAIRGNSAERMVVCVAINHYTPFTHCADEEHGKISRYAWEKIITG
jgi:epoxyqueuosine reductase QueG